MKNINWKVRFSKKNKTFITRFILALLVPVLAYMELDFIDITTWDQVGKILLDFITNPYLIILTLYNAYNMIPDGTTKGFGDSKKARDYKEPSK